MLKALFNWVNFKMLKRLYYKKSGYAGREEGITILEVIIATFILLVAIVGSYLAFTQILIETSSVSDRLVAAYLAQESIEVIRNIRDTDWISGSVWNIKLASCLSGCQVDYKAGTIEDGQPNLTPDSETPLNIDSDGFYTYGIGTPTKFKRKVLITSLGTDKLDFEVDVIWVNRGQSYNFRVEESLYNWK